MNKSNIVIDVHGHYGTYKKNPPEPMTDPWMTGDAATVVSRARECGIHLTVVSPLSALLPRGEANARKGNQEADGVVPQHPTLRQYVVVNPKEPSSYDQARELLKKPECIGIKIHPEEHCYSIHQFGKELFAFFTEMGVPVLTHSGCPNSLPIEFVPFIEAFPEVPLILAHLGNGAGDRQRPDLQVEAIRHVMEAPVYVDTSSSRSILSGLVEWAVDEIGAERILFGTDTPLYAAGSQLARIQQAEISQSDKAKILGSNAQALFSFSESDFIT